jgi:hypothetical protein
MPNDFPKLDLTLIPQQDALPAPNATVSTPLSLRPLPPGAIRFRADDGRPTAFESDTLDTFDRYGKNAAAEIASLPGAIPGLIGIAQAGATAVGDAVGDIFRGELPSVDWVATALSDKWEPLWREVNDPKTSPERQTELAAIFANEFDPQTALNWGLSNAQWWYNAGTDAVDFVDKQFGGAGGAGGIGFERVPGEVPLDEEAAGIIMSAFVGVPRAAIAKISNHIASFGGRNALTQFLVRVGQTKPARVVGRAAELATPLTLPLTPGNIAANAAVGVTLNDVMRTAFGEESVINHLQEAVTGEKLTLHEPQTIRDIGSGGIRQLVLRDIAEPSSADMEPTMWDRYQDALILAGGAGLAYALLRGRRSSVEPVINAGPNYDPSHGLEPQLTGPRGVQVEAERLIANSEAPLDEIARRAEPGNTFFESLASMFSRAGGEEGVFDALIHGRLPMTNMTIPSLRKLNTARADLGKERAELLNHYIAALDAQRYRQLAKDRIQESLNDLSDRWQRTMNAIVTRRNNGGDDSDLQRRRFALEAQINDLQLKAGRAKNVRMSLVDWSDDELTSIIRRAEADPDIVKLRRVYAEITDKMIDYRVRTGDIDADTAKQWRDDWQGVYMPLFNDPYLGKTGWRRWLHHVGQQMKGNIKAEASVGQERTVSPSLTRARNLDTDKADQVNQPLEPLLALNTYVARTVRHVQLNEVRRQFVDIMNSDPITSRGLRRVEFNSPANTVFTSLSHAQLSNPLFHGQVRDHMLPINKSGKVEFWEFGDASIRTALNFSPYTVMPVLNLFRRIKQRTTTGNLAPWFAPTALLFDTIGSITRRPGRSFGLIDEAVQRLSGGRLGIPGDPTVFLSAIGGAIKGVAWDQQLRVWGEWLANDLGAGSSYFGKMLTIAGGKDRLQHVGEAMINRYMRTTTGVLQREGHFGSTATWLDAGSDLGEGLSAQTTNPLLRQYQAVLEGVHNGAKIMFFNRNMAALRRQYPNGVPRHEVVRLAHETRTLAGNMQRAGASKWVQGITSSLPYSNVVLQSMSHFYGALTFGGFRGNNLHHGMSAWMGMFNYAFLFPLAGVTMINMSNDRVRNWYYNELAPWQRAGTVVLPTPDGLMKPAEEREPSDYVLLPLAPEAVPLKEMALVAWNKLYPIRPGEAADEGSLRDLTSAAATVLPLIAPPPLEAGINLAGHRLSPEGLLSGDSVIRERQPLQTAGANADAISPNSDIPWNVAESLSAIFGTAMRFGVNTVHSIEVVDDDENIDVFYEGIGIALDNNMFEIKKRVPVANSMLWGIETTQYSGTNVSREVYEPLRALEPVFGQFDVEIYGARGDRDGSAQLRARGQGTKIEPHHIMKQTEHFTPQEMRSAVSVIREQFDADPTIKELKSRMTDISKTMEFWRGAMSTKPEERHKQLSNNERERQNIARELESYIDHRFEEFRRWAGLPETYTPQDFAKELRASLGPRQ